MNSAIFWLELRHNRKLFLIWLGVITAVTALLMSFYPSVQMMQDTMAMMIKGMPEGMANAFGMDVNMFANIVGYYSTYYGMHVMILGGCFSISLAGNMIAKEEREGTADFLLSKPLTRMEVISSKIAATYVLIILFLMVQFVVATAMIFWLAKEDEIQVNNYIIMTTYGFLLNIMFCAMGLFLSLLVKRGKAMTGALIGIVVGGFVLQAFSRISNDAEWIGWFSPFKYANFLVSKADYGFDAWRLIVLIGVSVLCIVGTYVVYGRKDMNG